MGTLAFVCVVLFGLGLPDSPHDDVSVSDIEADEVRADFRTLSRIGLGI